MREDAQAKARRLLVEGRVRVLAADEDAGLLSAEVRGDSARVYVVSHDVDGWACTCRARGRCSHLQALQLVVVMAPREATWH